MRPNGRGSAADRRLRPMTNGHRLGLALVLVGWALLGCQPADDPLQSQADEEAEDAPDDPPVGVAERGVPQTLDALFERVEGTAGEWQTGAREVEVLARLDDGEVGSAQVTYVGPGADRFLVIELTEDGMAQDAPRLAGLELQIVPGAALDEIEPPDALADPADLVGMAGEALGECGMGDEVSSVLYATGAPAAWTGDGWATAPSWRALLGIGDAGTVEVDPRSGTLAEGGCRPAS